VLLQRIMVPRTSYCANPAVSTPPFLLGGSVSHPTPSTPQLHLPLPLCLLPSGCSHLAKLASTCPHYAHSSVPGMSLV
jgi:hypothetical protein